MASIFDKIRATPNDGAFHELCDGVTARRRDSESVIVSVAVEYQNGDPNAGYVEGCPAALLSPQIPVGKVGDCGVDGPGCEYWSIRAPFSTTYRVEFTTETNEAAAFLAVQGLNGGNVRDLRTADIARVTTAWFTVDEPHAVEDELEADVRVLSYSSSAA